MNPSSIRVKEKVLIVGKTGTMKTIACFEIAKVASKAGRNVLYVDTEYGSQRYFKSVKEEEVKNVDLVVPKNFSGLRSAICRIAVGDFELDALNNSKNFDFHTITEKKAYDVLILDPFDPVTEARLEAKDKFIKQGYYYIGEKRVEIDNKDTFTLRGYMYQVPNEWIDELYRFMVRAPFSFVHTILLPNERIQEYYGWYDAIFEFTKTGEEFEAKVIKLRGKSVKGSIATSELIKKVCEWFI